MVDPSDHTLRGLAPRGFCGVGRSGLRAAAPWRGAGPLGILCFFVAVANASAAARGGVVIDQIVAVVDNEPITESELMLETRVALIAREGAAGLLLADGPLDPEILLSTRDYLINQILIDNHVRRLGGLEVPNEAIERAVESFEATFPSHAAVAAFKRRFGISDEILRAILRRDLSNDLYIKQRMRAWVAGVSSEGEQAARSKRALERWLEDLRRGTDLRILGPTGELERQ